MPISNMNLGDLSTYIENELPKLVDLFTNRYGRSVLSAPSGKIAAQRQEQRANTAQNYAGMFLPDLLKWWYTNQFNKQEEAPAAPTRPSMNPVHYQTSVLSPVAIGMPGNSPNYDSFSSGWGKPTFEGNKDLMNWYTNSMLKYKQREQELANPFESAYGKAAKSGTNNAMNTSTSNDYLLDIFKSLFPIK